MYVEPHEPLWSEFDSIAQDEGLKLYDIERVGHDGVRVFVQPFEQSGDLEPKGVSSEDCSRLCRRLLVFSTADGTKLGLPAEPRLEVSSPGINRHLRLPNHFCQGVGEHVRVLLSGVGKEGPTSNPVVGVIKAVDSHAMTVVEDITNGEIQIPFSSVKKAKVEFLF